MTTHPLELPEILLRIGHFIPLWVHIPHIDNYRMQPQALVPFVLVSRLWYNTLSSLLWYFYDTELTNEDMPQSVIAYFSPYIRILRATPQMVWPFECTNLTELVLRRFSSKFYNFVCQTYSYNAFEFERQMVRSNHDLKALDWTCPLIHLPTLDANDFVQLIKLESLTLNHWNSAGGEFGRVLQAVAGSLRRLRVGYLTGKENDDEAYVTRDMISKFGRRTLALPKLESFELITKLEDKCLGVIRCCPKLTTFNACMLGGSDEDARQLAKDLCDFCPKLTTLVLEQDGGEAANLIIAACSAGNRLSRIKITMSGVSIGTGSAIALHAATLKDVIIINLHDSRSWKGALVPLVGCPGLKSFHFISHDFRMYESLVLKQILVEEWNCHELEILELDIPIRPDVSLYDSEGNEVEEEEEEEEYPTDCISQIMDNWFLHPQASFAWRSKGSLRSVPRRIFEELLRRFQGMTSVQIVVLSGRVFTRSSDAKIAVDPRIWARFHDE
ncbi:MAG: hypothetical protein JOS17DRAFT_797467 [Linnemannia elongata]|nr:MAG: hypothetical protein JOS17DRAFT_797467 [Linnemannia elongata]